MLQALKSIHLHCIGMEAVISTTTRHKWEYVCCLSFEWINSLVSWKLLAVSLLVSLCSLNGTLLPVCSKVHSEEVLFLCADHCICISRPWVHVTKFCEPGLKLILYRSFLRGWTTCIHNVQTHHPSWKPTSCIHQPSTTPPVHLWLGTDFSGLTWVYKQLIWHLKKQIPNVCWQQNQMCVLGGDSGVWQQAFYFLPLNRYWFTWQKHRGGHSLDEWNVSLLCLITGLMGNMVKHLLMWQ